MGLVVALCAAGAWRISALLEPASATVMPMPAISGKTALESKDARIEVSLWFLAAHPIIRGSSRLVGRTCAG